MRSEDAVVQGMFLFQGFIDAGRGLLELNMGQIDAAQELAPWAQQVSDIVVQKAQEDWEFPGVFEYEVTEEFGAWLRRNWDTKDDGEKLARLQRMVEDFLGHGKRYATQQD